MILKNKLVKNTSWTAVSFIVVSLVYVLRLSILTRFLSKEDFGLIALTLFVLGFTNIFADLGISTVILSKDNLTKKEYSSLYWVGILLSIVLYMLLLVIAPFFSNFYKEPMLMNLIPVMGIDLIISTMGRQFNTYMQKEFRFKTIAIIKISSEIGSLVLALILALNGFGIWSLIVSLLTASLMNALGSIILEYKFHPLQLYCNIKKTKHLYSIGLYQTGSQILDYISSQIDVLLLGKLLPLGDMGVYSIIKTLVVRIYSSVNQVFTKVTVPLLAKVQFDYKQLKAKYMGIIQIIGIINAFLFLLFIVNSELVLHVFYGEKLMNYSWVFAILCVWGYFSSIVNCAAGVIIATGSTRIGFVWTQIRLLINPIFVLVGGYYWGMLGVCISQAIYSILVILLYYRLVIFRIIKNISITDFIKCFYKPTLYSSAIYFFTFGISFIFGSSLNPYVYLSITIIVATLCFYLLLRKDLFKSILLFKE